MDNVTHPGLSPAEMERLDLLTEEAAEVIQAAAKIKRHGYDSHNPTVPLGQQVSNLSELHKELGHLSNAARLMQIAGDLDTVAVQEAATQKAKGISKWLHHQDEGVLETLKTQQVERLAQMTDAPGEPAL